MWCSILEEGSDLNIEIHEYYRREKYFGIRRGNKDNVPCRTSIKFDDLWKHLVSEEQEGTKCELIFSSITLDLLRVLQPTSRWSLRIRSKDYVSVSSPRYAILTTGIFAV